MPAGTQTIIRDVVCPFCSLLCDDLVLKLRGNSLTVRSKGCPRSIRGFEYRAAPAAPRIVGERVTLEQAIKRAAQILKRARQPLISGMGTDVAGCRAALALAEKCGAVVDHMHGDAAMSNTLVLQNRGWMQTTLTELRNRADLVVLVGTDGVHGYPRFFERHVWPQRTLFQRRLKQRQIIYIGENLNTRPGIAPDGRRPWLIECRAQEIGELVGALHALQRGLELQPERSLPRRRITALRGVVKSLRSARYGVFVWSAADLQVQQRDLIVNRICELVTSLNETTRFAGLSLGGGDGGASCVNATAWQTGFPLPVNFAGGTPQHDPYLYSTRRMIDAGVLDALLWISSFDEEAIPPAGPFPTIVLARPSGSFARHPEVYIPVGTPGVDHPGSLFRTDGVVSLPVRALRRATQVRPAGEILGRIRECL